MNYLEIPIYIISYNRLTELKKCIERLLSDGYTNVNVIDNASDDELLLEYLKSLELNVFFMDKNYGHMVFWECGEFDEIIQNAYYVVTDCDVVPSDDCPNDYLEFFYNILSKYCEYTKVGFSLKIDDLPVENTNRMDVIRWESFFYDNVISYNPLLYDARLDTTFALYRPGLFDYNDMKVFEKGIRTGEPYEAHHLPWYWDMGKPTDEQASYLEKGSVYGNSFFEENKLKRLNFSIINNLVERVITEDKKNEIYLKFAKNQNKIYIYGEGVRGEKIYKMLESNKVLCEGYIVSDEYFSTEYKNNVRIYKLSEIVKKEDFDAGIIISCVYRNQIEILNLLYDKGFTRVCAII